MPVFTHCAVCLVCFAMLVGCGGRASLPEADIPVSRAWQAWQGGWHAVWQVEWVGAPVRGPLVAEVWHAPDGRLRIETLEAPSAALSGLTLVRDGRTAWLYDVRQDRLNSGPPEQVRIPLIQDAIDASEWLLAGTEGASIQSAGRDNLESGPATRMDVTLATGERATLWIDTQTGLPSRVELQSSTWGEATFTARTLDVLQHPHPSLFTLIQDKRLDLTSGAD
jgi:outer membrane lipoprotein-sorting protein